MEEHIRIQDDLYCYVNGEWQKTAKLPADEPFTGGFFTLSQDLEKLLMKDFDTFAKGTIPSGIPAFEDSVRLYRKAVDAKSRSDAGMQPLFPLLEKLTGIRTMDDLNALSGELAENRVPLPFQILVCEDFKDSSHYSFGVVDPPILLPDKTYYAKRAAKKLILSLYKRAAKKLLAFTPLSKKEQKQFLADTIAYDELIAQKVKSHEELADYVKSYNPMDIEALHQALAPFDFNGLLKQLYGKDTAFTTFTGNPRLVDEFSDFFNADTLQLYLHWAYLHTLFAYAPCLSVEIAEAADSYINKLMGVKKAPTVEKRAYKLVSRIFSEPIGVYYGRTYFGEEAKADVTEMVRKIIATYQTRVEKNDFLDDKTKQKAIRKLSTIRIKMGYPDGVNPLYEQFRVDESDSFFEAMTRIALIRRKDELNKVHRPVDRNEWAMPGHMVNACYDPSKNDITFPAAILQKPFYDLNQTVSENLGGIGAVIGHEISHAFDNNGSHFDENGNLSDWWKEEDFRQFEERTKAMTEQYDGIPFHGGKVNGALVVSENIADNGGMAVTIEIMHHTPDADFKQYFLNWGRIWRMKASEKIIKLLLTNDVHSPSVLRANRTPLNFAEWYETFGVQSTDKMYIPGEKRISIW